MSFFAQTVRAAYSVRTLDPDIVIFPAWHIAPPASHLAVGLVVALLTGTLALAIFRLVRALRAARRAEVSTAGTTPLKEGRQWVSGRVELASDSPCPARVSVHQRGSESLSRGRWSYRWEETGRETEAHRFYLRRDDGTRIRVEPGTDLQLVSPLKPTEQNEREHRTLRAEVEAGASARVEGDLSSEADPEVRESAGYRALPPGWCLRPPRGAKLTLSLEPRGAEHRRAAARWASVAWLTAGLMLVSLTSFSSYLARVFFGRDAAVEVVDQRGRVPRARGAGVRVQYSLEVMWHGSDGENVTWEETLRSEDFDPGRRRGQRLPCRYVPGWRAASSIGSGSSIALGWWLLGLVCALAALGKMSATSRHREWYERKLSESGRGRLPEPTGGVDLGLAEGIDEGVG